MGLSGPIIDRGLELIERENIGGKPTHLSGVFKEGEIFWRDDPTGASTRYDIFAKAYMD